MPPTAPPTIAPMGGAEAERWVPGLVGVAGMYTVVGATVEVGDRLVEPGVIEAEGPTRIHKDQLYITEQKSSEVMIIPA